MRNITLDLAKYRENVIPYIKRVVTNRNKPGEDLVGDIAAGYPLHIVVVCHLIGELYGYTPMLLKKLERLEEYYHILEVKHQKRSL